uniref:HD/PDEase domain-containing protein n=1 Tax=Trypanosoma congolense (strain IL3000) TaxID=1068625 RepID=G0UXP0_TRYCI|nr:conserved hypothetical protein [Trypanosoma congolense IL3000]
MHVEHYQLWERCRGFVKEMCVGRDPSHGLPHAEKVTEIAVLIFCMQEQTSTSDAAATLSRIIFTAMIHDVADHKYDSEGTLKRRLETFVQDEPSEALGTRESRIYVLQTIEAISFSAEKRCGRRWFASTLPDDWLRVRDIVSDADKLEAIGHAGLIRCLQYTVHSLSTRKGDEIDKEHHERWKAEGRPHWSAAAERQCLDAVRKHFEEKLTLLSTHYIVTRPGHFLSQRRHAEMCETLSEWEMNGLPPLAR